MRQTRYSTIPPNRIRRGWATSRPLLAGSLAAAVIGTQALAAPDPDALAGGVDSIPSFVRMFFISSSAGPDGVIRTEWFGTILIWILIGLSVFGIGLTIKLASANSRQTILPTGQVSRTHKRMQAGSWEEVMLGKGGTHTDFELMIRAALEEAPDGLQAMIARTEQVASETTTMRFRSIEPLNVLGQVSPMIGLFGTVYGMILAFQSIVASGGSADPVALAGGIGTALVTTFWGLLVAIPALAGYAVIRNRVDALSSEAEATVVDLLERFRPRSDAGDRTDGTER